MKMSSKKHSSMKKRESDKVKVTMRCYIVRGEARNLTENRYLTNSEGQRSNWQELIQRIPRDGRRYSKKGFRNGLRKYIRRKRIGSISSRVCLRTNYCANKVKYIRW